MRPIIRRGTLLITLVAQLAMAAEKKPIAFSGKLESIDFQHLTVAVKHGEIKGFMPAMTMDYPVENRAVLNTLSAGDEIAATVYVGDPTLHNLRIVRHDTKDEHR